MYSRKHQIVILAEQEITGPQVNRILNIQLAESRFYFILIHLKPWTCFYLIFVFLITEKFLSFEIAYYFNLKSREICYVSEYSTQ